MQFWQITSVQTQGLEVWAALDLPHKLNPFYNVFTAGLAYCNYVPVARELFPLALATENSTQLYEPCYRGGVTQDGS